MIELIETNDIMFHIAQFSQAPDIVRLSLTNTLAYNAINNQTLLWKNLFHGHFPNTVWEEEENSNNSDYRQLFNQWSNKTLQVVINIKGSGLPLWNKVFTKSKRDERVHVLIEGQLTCPKWKSIPCKLPPDCRSGVIYSIETREGISERHIQAVMKAAEIYGYLQYGEEEYARVVYTELKKFEANRFLNVNWFDDDQVLEASGFTEQDTIDGFSLDNYDLETKEAMIKEMELTEEQYPLQYMTERYLDALSHSTRMQDVEVFIDWMLDEFELPDYSEYKAESITKFKLEDIKIYRDPDNPRLITVCYFLQFGAPIKKLLKYKSSNSYGRVKSEDESGDTDYYGFLLYPAKKFLDQLVKMREHPEKYAKKKLTRSFYPKWRTLGKELLFGTLDFASVGPTNRPVKAWWNCGPFWVLDKYMNGLSSLTFHERSGSQLRFEFEKVFPLMEHIIQAQQYLSHSDIEARAGAVNSIIEEMKNERLKDIEEEERDTSVRMSKEELKKLKL
jgi:hypothetical protein